MQDLDLSVVVPLFDEEESVGRLVDAVRGALAGHGTWELILVDDGSRDATAEVASDIAAGDPRVRLVRLARNYGQTAAMQAGFDHARGAVVVTMDGDLQNDPQDIPKLIAKLHEGYDLVTGYREKRKDRFVTRKIPSWVANRIIRWLTGVPIRDNGCSLKAYRAELVSRLSLYSDMHRFIPALAAAVGGARIAEVPVRHHARRYGRSKYGLSRVAKVLADLFTIKMICSFRERPLLMFGLGAFGATMPGLAFAAATVVAWIGFRPDKAVSFVFPAASLLWFGLAGYLLMLGLIAEVALRNQRQADGGELPLAHELGT